MKKDFIDIRDHSRETLLKIIRRASEFKAGTVSAAGKNRALALIFTKASTRTNVSFQRAIQKLGGEAVYLGGNTLQLSRGETIHDTAKTLSRYVDCVVIRTYSHRDVTDFARYSSVPVINGLTDFLHPCQAMGDVMSLMERSGEEVGRLKMAYVGDGNNVCHSLINAASVFGFSLSVASPEGYDPDPDILKKAREHNSGIELFRDPVEAVERADAIYTDVWVSMGDEDQKKERLEVFNKYQVNSELLSHASDGAAVMHCLPAHRGEEISAEVIDGPHSYVFEQAENRLHIQQAIIEYLISS